MRTDAWFGRLANQAAAHYRICGRSTYHFARAKLQHDPVYRLILTEALIPGAARIVDLGCGQALLATWLAAAQECYHAGRWNSICPVPARIASYRGIDRNPAEIHRARQALGDAVELDVGDAGSALLHGATLVVLLDVLHYLDYEAQRQLLGAVHAALPANGLLLLRVGDHAGGLRARASAWVDRQVLRLRGYGNSRLHSRSLADWLQLLTEVGFTTREIARQQSLAYANCVLRASPRAH